MNQSTSYKAFISSAVGAVLLAYSVIYRYSPALQSWLQDNFGVSDSIAKIIQGTTIYLAAFTSATFLYERFVWRVLFRISDFTGYWLYHNVVQYPSTTNTRETFGSIYIRHLS